MAYKNKTYVCFDGDSDIRYYNLMKAWKQNDNSEFNFYDAHDLNNAWDTSSEETIKNKLRERLNNTKIMIILLGQHTKHLTKFVKWEMEVAKKKNLPIIVVNLNNKKYKDKELFPTTLQDYITINISFNSKIIQYALENWESSHYSYLKKNDIYDYYYIDSVYEKLGL